MFLSGFVFKGLLDLKVTWGYFFFLYYLEEFAKD